MIEIEAGPGTDGCPAAGKRPGAAVRPAAGKGPAPPRGPWVVLGLAVVAALLPATPAAAQDPEPHVLLGSDTARVGDVVPVAVRVPVAPGERVAWPDTLPLAGSALENAVRVREEADTVAGRAVRAGIYAVTPWRTGELRLPEVAVEVVGGDESPREVRVSGPTLAVMSVLPGDTAGVEPKPARGVIGADWAWGTIVLMIGLAAAVILALVWWWRRGRPVSEEAISLEPQIPPRERALAALRAARSSGLLERGELKEFYSRFSEAVRGYMAALHASWGEDLTTTELLSRIRTQVGPSEAAALREVLDPADRVKFARREPDAGTALAEWEGARSWVEEFDWPPRREAPTEEAA